MLCIWGIWNIELARFASNFVFNNFKSKKLLCIFSSFLQKHVPNEIETEYFYSQLVLREAHTKHNEI